jgi:hypothetical protein
MRTGSSSIKQRNPLQHNRFVRRASTAAPSVQLPIGKDAEQSCPAVALLFFMIPLEKRLRLDRIAAMDW